MTPTVELLERSAELAALDGHLAAVRAQGRGRLVLVAGEAGIGKTALVRAFCERTRPSRVLWGACDALFTPRPLGPFVDIADDVGGALGHGTCSPLHALRRERSLSWIAAVGLSVLRRIYPLGVYCRIALDTP